MRSHASMRDDGAGRLLTILSSERMEKGFWIVSRPLTRKQPGVSMWMPSCLKRWMKDALLHRYQWGGEEGGHEVRELHHKSGGRMRCCSGRGSGREGWGGEGGRRGKGGHEVRELQRGKWRGGGACS